jgi:cell division protease FtsH
MLLLRKIPLQVFSSTVDSEMEGMVSNPPSNSIASKIWIKNQIAVLLGGLCAEKIIFGEDALSLGSESDLRMATQLAMKALLKNGFYKYPVSFTPAADDNNLAVSTLTEELDRECIRWMQEAESYAMETLKNNMELLLNCSWKLSERRSVDKKDLRNLFLRFASVENRSSWFESTSESEKYREILHSQKSGAIRPVMHK